MTERKTTPPGPPIREDESIGSGVDDSARVGPESTRLTEVSEEFDYSQKVRCAEGDLWSEHYPPHLAVYANLVEHRNRRVSKLASGGQRLLDIGCGMGDLLVSLQDRYADLFGIDPSIDMVGQAKKNVRALGLGNRSTILQGIAEAIELDDEFVDTVLMLDVYEHIRPGARHAALREIRRVMRDGGELILATPSRYILRFWNVFDNVLLLPRRIRSGQPVQFWSLPMKTYTEAFVTQRELLDDLRDAGFSVESRERVSFYPAPERPGFFDPWLLRLYRRPSAYGFSEFLFGVAGSLPILRQKMLVRCTK